MEPITECEIDLFADELPAMDEIWEQLTQGARAGPAVLDVHGRALKVHFRSH